MSTTSSTHSCTLISPAFRVRSGFRGASYALSIPVNPVRGEVGWGGEREREREREEGGREGGREGGEGREGGRQREEGGREGGEEDREDGEYVL